MTRLHSNQFWSKGRRKNWPQKFEHPDKWSLCYFGRPYRPESRERRWQEDPGLPTPKLKAKVVPAAMVWDKAIAELALLHDVYPNWLAEWKRQLVDRAVDVFGG